ncbi:uncharacterized protein K452DRAFT_360292 [Aplosporella prunicola CBS 121167]|uniref:Uncharacterized protein n=1 Tax=Aplosporella prunicola CBS 121167 TaxID=1176127 RepID=A0A6A6BAF8_9PEZI|nr:uncharacterized protein K452DRAFT_360292 [Aplosporella prunicola CBS 121167]KAF2139491.1 hypothetical protein K452DRAFT_360292 [Aplosporella prunicola CBS 121167]
MNHILDEKVVLITGGASGLGRAAAKACLEAKAKVVIADINEKMLKECEEELKTRWHVGPLRDLTAVVADVSDEVSAARAVDHAVHTFGKLDVLVNNAGIFDTFDPVDTVDMQIWNRVLAVNLTGPVLMSKYAVKHFLDRKATGCSIINIGSIAGLRGAHAGAAYTTSKHGLIGLTKNTAAAYLQQGIRCNALLPGNMETNIVHSVPGTINESKLKICQDILDVHPDYLDADKVAKSIVHLASEWSETINGAIITADGGFTTF